MYQSFKMALKAIAGNKMRSFLTVLGVVIGVVAIVVLVAIAQGTNASVVSSIEGMGTNMLTVSIRARRQNPVTMAGLNERIQPDLGVPSLYYLWHMDNSPEEITEEDLDVVRDCWNRWEEKRKGMKLQLD